MAYSPHHDGRSHSRNASTPSLSAHMSMGNDYFGAESPADKYNDSKFNLLQTTSGYPDTRSESRLNSTADEKMKPKMEVVEKQSITASRKRWMFFVWVLTFWIPTPFIGLIVRSPRKDIREAWREKLAINMMIWFSCLAVMFFMSMCAPF
jgi:chitin synthase